MTERRKKTVDLRACAPAACAMARAAAFLYLVPIRTTDRHKQVDRCDAMLLLFREQKAASCIDQITICIGKISSTF